MVLRKKIKLRTLINVNELKEKFEIINQRLLELLGIEEDIKYINNPNEEYFNSVVLKSSFVYRLYERSLRILVIEICKLLDPREGRNFISFSRNLNNEYKNINWKNPIEKSRLLEIQRELENYADSDVFLRIKNSRDKHYVHDDSNKHVFEMNTQFDDIWNLLFNLRNICNELNYALYNTTMYYKFSIKASELQALSSYYNFSKYLRNLIREDRGNEILLNLMNHTIYKKIEE